jgi:hypothetical protein
MLEQTIYTSGSAPVDIGYDALGNQVAVITTSSKLVTTIPVSFTWGNATVSAAQAIGPVYASGTPVFVADTTYQVVGATGYPTVFGSAGFGTNVVKISAGQSNPTVVGGLLLLTNSLCFTSAILQKGSVVQSAAYTQLAQGDILAFLAGGVAPGQNTSGGAQASATITLVKI